MSRPTYLYRHFGKDGALLYVGVSVEPAIRTKHHSKRSMWFRDVANITTEWFPSREEALAAERRAVADENPTYNRKLGGRDGIYHWTRLRPPKPVARIDIRMTTETKATLIGLAEADHRTLSSLLEKIIAEWLKRQQGGRKAA